MRTDLAAGKEAIPEDRTRCSSRCCSCDLLFQRMESRIWLTRSSEPIQFASRFRRPSGGRALKLEAVPSCRLRDTRVCPKLSQSAIDYCKSLPAANAMRVNYLIERSSACVILCHAWRLAARRLSGALACQEQMFTSGDVCRLTCGPDGTRRCVARSRAKNRELIINAPLLPSPLSLSPVVGDSF